MTTLFKHKCPSCGQSMRLEDRHLARRVKCPKCQHVFEPTEVHPSSQQSLDSSPGAVSVDTVVNARLETKEDDSKPSTEDRTEKPLRTLGRYELKKVLGQGGFGRVYLAFDPQLERDVAIKVLTQVVNNQVRVQRFLTEAKAAARLRHPYIVPTFESGKEDNRYYIASEFIEGTLLSDEATRSSLDERGAVDCVRKLATALAYAHENNVVHRDIKPQNIIVDAAGEPHLMDFGLARRTDEESNLTTDGAMLGTPAYMSPEQARGDFGKVGPASDQYSLGVVLYQLLTGQTPFDGLPHLVVTQVANGDVPPIHSIRPDVSADVAAVCEKSMQKLPGDRYASCKEFADDIAAWLNGMPVAARPLNSVQQAIRFVGQHRLIASMTSVTLCLFAVLGVCVWQLFGGPESNLAAPQTALKIQSNVETATDPEPEKSAVLDTTDASTAMAPETAEPNETTTATNSNADAVQQEVPAISPALPVSAVSEIDAGIAALLGESSGWEWGSPEPAVWVGGKGHYTGTPAISMDGLTVAVASLRPGGAGTSDIWVTRRNNLSDAWPELTNPGHAINSVVADWSPALSPNGDALYFHSHRPGGRDGNIWISEWDAAALKWKDAVKLPESVNTTGIEQQPAISPDGLEFIVWSNGPASRAGGELWQHRRQDVAQPFGDGVKVREASPVLKDVNLQNILFYSPESLSAVFSVQSGSSGKALSFILCHRSTPEAPWQVPSIVTALPSDFYDVTYSPAAKLMLLHHDTSNSIWQMQLVPKEAESPAVATTGLLGSKAVDTVKDSTPLGVSSTEIDLLSLIDPAECAVVGNWTRTANGIQSPKVNAERLQIPFVPDGEYDLTVVVKPLDDLSDQATDGITIGLISEGNPFHVLLNYAGWAALEQVDELGVGGGPGPGRNTSKVRCSNIMQRNNPATVVCRVRRNGVTIDVDSSRLIDWTGQPKQLSRNGYWIMPFEHALFIGGFSRYEVSKISLSPVTGTGMQLPPPRIKSADSLKLASSTLNVELELLEEAAKSWSLSVNDSIDGELALGLSGSRRSIGIAGEDIPLVTNLKCPVHLTLAGSDLPGLSAETVGRLAAMPSLRKLTITGRDGKTVPLLTGLSANKSLRYLILDYQQLDERQVSGICKIPTLRRLQLNYTGLTDACVEIIASSLPELESLHIGHMGSKSQLTIACIKSVSSLAQLKELSIRDSKTIDDECIDDLLKLKQLTALWIDGTSITKTGHDRLKSQMPKTTIVWTQ